MVQSDPGLHKILSPNERKFTIQKFTNARFVEMRGGFPNVMFLIARLIMIKTTVLNLHNWAHACCGSINEFFHALIEK